MQEFPVVSRRVRSSIVSMLLNHMDISKVTPSTPARQTPNCENRSLQVNTSLGTDYMVKSS